MSNWQKADAMVHAARRDEKICVSCGRRITFRKKWAASWDEVRYCSDGCRAAKVSPADVALEAAIAALLEARGAGKTICPSEAARAVGGEGWRASMEAARRAARRMVARGQIVMTQGGHVVDPSTAKGAVRLRLR